jgi:hypothetical protein
VLWLYIQSVGAAVMSARCVLSLSVCRLVSSTDYELPEDDAIESKRRGSAIKRGIINC